MAITNTGIVERVITGVNESDLFLDSEATSVATNTGIVERSVVGVNDGSDPFTDQSTSTATNNNTAKVRLNAHLEDDYLLNRIIVLPSRTMHPVV